MIPALPILYVLLCIMAAVAGRRSRVGFWGMFFFAFLLTPVLTLVFQLITGPSRQARRA